MDNQFYCKNKDRWKKVSETPGINGIDYLEVSLTDQKTITVYFLHDLLDSPFTTPPLTEKNIFIEGGVRVKDINVLTAAPIQNVLTIIVDKAGDFSTYVFKIGNSFADTGNPPPGFDEQLSSVEFSFKINCPSEFDCKTGTVCQPGNTNEIAIDYLAKDYSSFTRLMTDRLSIIAPGWKERNAADLQIVLIELLAYVGDHLSYYQDAIATEAYLGTARRRISARRHARLLDYFVHDGCNARAWVCIQTVSDGLHVGQGRMVMAAGNADGKPTITEKEAQKIIKEEDPVVFETMHDITLFYAHNDMTFYTWCDNNCCLPKGSTNATLVNKRNELGELTLQIQSGDVLVFEEVRSPVTGAGADADPTHRWPVRLKNVQKGIDNLTKTDIVNIEWYPQDALPFALRITATNTIGEQLEISKARGNIVLADHGATQKNKQLYPAVANKQKYYPKLVDKNITGAVAYRHGAEKTIAASLAVKQDPHQAIPAVHLVNQKEIWAARKDLLGSDKFATEFVVETENDGTSYLRFGDNILGKSPGNGFSPEAIYRIGSGSKGNVGAEAINKIVWNDGGIVNVRNLLPALGGKEAETMEEIRQFAPQAFRRQERAVVGADYVEKTKLHPEVQNAIAKFYWTGSWYTVYIIIDRKKGKEVDKEFKQEIIRLLEQYRMAAYDLEIVPPTFVPLDLELQVCVEPGYFRASVKQNLFAVFSNAELPNGTKGFFHPDNFSFGQPVYLSAIYQKAMSVIGVSSVEIKTFQRWAKKPNGEIEKGLLAPSSPEIIRLDNDPSLPENGKIEFTMLNGL